MLFKPRGVQAQKPEKPKNQMTLADMLAFRDTWTDIPYENFSVGRILLKAHLEKQRKAEVPKLVTSENGFRVRNKDDMDESELELRRVQGALNKLTEKNFDSVVSEMLSEDLIANPFVLKGAVNIIFSKAVAEPVFSSVYARLCARFANYERDVIVDVDSKPLLREKLEKAQKELSSADTPLRFGDFVRRVLINRCQAFYEQFTSQGIPESAEAEEHLRKQNMANIKFLGELYIKSMVTTTVIASVASYALALGWEPKATKTTVSDVDLELTYNLFTVVGKKFDETATPHMIKAIWDPITTYSEDKAFSMRVRFLLQNLIDLRNNGWKAKETPATAASPEEGQENQRPPPPPQRPIHRASSMQQQDGFGGGNRRGGNNNMMVNAPEVLRREDHPPVNHGDPPMYAPPMGNMLATPPYQPAPFNQAEAPQPFQGTEREPVISEEDKKLIALAQPPSSLTDDIEKSILSILRDAVTDKDWPAAAAALAEAIPGEQKHTCVMCAAFAATKKICVTSIEEDRQLFTEALNNNALFDASALARAHAWFLAYAIAYGLKEDIPRSTLRFAQLLVKTKSLSFIVMLRDVMARSANYLDALYVPLEGEGGTWEEDYIEMWSRVLEEWCKGRDRDHETADPKTIIECLSTIKQRPFMRDVAPDFLMELFQSHLISDEAIHEWVGSHGKEEKHKAFAAQLEQLFA